MLAPTITLLARDTAQETAALHALACWAGTFTPRVSLTYAASDDVNIYAAYGRGFKSGGFDMRGDATATPATKDGYDAEIVDSYELGLKGDFLDGQFRMNAAVFYTDYAGQQVTTQVPKVTPPPGVVSFVDNVGSSRIWG